VISRKSFSNNFVTFLWLSTAFFLGYGYARLSRDEYARRRAYARYSNFMTMFDSFSRAYEAKYSALIDFLVTFDHTEWMWRMRHYKWAEFQEKRRLQKQIMEKEA
jgi:hypothetical protein